MSSYKDLSLVETIIFLGVGVGILVVKLSIVVFVLWLLYKLVMHVTGGA